MRYSSLAALVVLTSLPLAAAAQGPLGRTRLQLAPLGPPGVTVVAQGSAALVSWSTAAGATAYQVHRGLDSVSFAPISPASSATSYLDQSVLRGATFYYRVAAIYPDGRQGMSSIVSFAVPMLVAASSGTRTSLGAIQQPSGGGATIGGIVSTPAPPPPPVVNPSWAKATAVAGMPGAYDLTWEMPTGATSYLVSGPSLTNGRVSVAGNPIRVFNVPRGPQSWRVVAVFSSGSADSGSAAVASTVVRTLPQRGIPFLTRAGTGSEATAFPHMDVACGEALDCYNGRELTGSFTFIVPLWGPPNRPYTEAVYGNATDLGVGRRTDCAQGVTRGQNPRAVTVCYATNHGVGPGQPGFADPAFITGVAAGGNTFAPQYSAERERREGTPTLAELQSMDRWEGMRRSASMIVLDASGSAQFFSFDAGVNQMPGSLGWNWRQQPVPIHTAVLDSEGDKFVPHVCMTCHGGRYNPSTNKVDGASLLPLDPNLLSFANTATGNRASQEENIRRINAVIVMSGSSPAVKSYIYGLYGNTVLTPGARAVPDYVPSGWSQQAGLYRSVVKPYCAMCHLAAPPNVSFLSWGNFQQNAGLIHQSVCKSHTMPQAELPYRDFWLKDTGILYLPGLLAASLGYPSCE